MTQVLIDKSLWERVVALARRHTDCQEDACDLGHASWLTARDIAKAYVREVEPGECANCRDENGTSYKSMNMINGDCIMIMRGHLELVGIEATFADDCAAIAAVIIKETRAERDALKAQLAEMRAALELYDNEAWHTDWDYWTSGNAGDASRAHQVRETARAALFNASPKGET